MPPRPAKLVAAMQNGKRTTDDRSTAEQADRFFIVGCRFYIWLFFQLGSGQGRTHSALDGQTPVMVYFAPLPQREAAERELRRASRSTPRFLSNSLGPPLMAREGAARKPRGGFPASMIGEATCEDQAYRAP